ncbi:hypothetical protein AB0M68_03425 [Streptomyces sp. NPDC051453]|uniref:hypothetical protein n=1 Tax=Streptomyces sp. NPDC051453 TaxID=3154941 RepID=UPI00341D534A
MPPTPPARGSSRSADELNEAIRQLWPHPSMRLTPEQRAKYEQLVTEWAAAVRAGIVEAA